MQKEISQKQACIVESKKQICYDSEIVGNGTKNTSTKLNDITSKYDHKVAQNKKIRQKIEKEIFHERVVYDEIYNKFEKELNVKVSNSYGLNSDLIK